MQPEIIIDEAESSKDDEGLATLRLTYAEVGSGDGTIDSPTDRVYLHVEDGESGVTLFLTQDQAYALMAALGQAARAL